GWIEQYRSEMQKALSAFDAALAIDAEYAPAHHGRAQALRYLGDQEQALGAARTAAALEPENADFRRLAATLMERSDTIVSQVAAPSSSRPQQDRPSSPVTRPQSRKPQPNVPHIPLQPDGSLLSWDDIILPERTKRTLRQVQKVIEAPEQARRLGVELLYGPPGTGKTTIAKILASQASCSFFAASPADVFSKWIGEGEKAVSNLFAQARAAAPSIVFLDEIDALVPNRSGGVSQPSDKIVNQFLHEIDGLSGNQGVFVVGATNRPELLDDAVIRGGRLSLKIEIPAPDKDSRLSILALHTRGVVLSPDVDIEQLATETEGYSGADLRALVNDAGLEALVRITDEGGAECLTTEDFEHAKRAIQPEVAPGQ
ncbi:MAG: hypothetical protein RLZZ78_814, partial [Armatimonadota bacterium]